MKIILGIAVIFLFFMFLAGNASALTDIDSCQTLSIENETYVLNASITGTSGTCFTISADGITLDYDGFETRGSGIQIRLVNSDRFTLIDCKATSTGNDTVSITNATGVIVLNCYFNTTPTNQRGVNFLEYASDVLMQNVTVVGASSTTSNHFGLSFGRPTAFNPNSAFSNVTLNDIFLNTRWSRNFAIFNVTGLNISGFSASNVNSPTVMELWKVNNYNTENVYISNFTSSAISFNNTNNGRMVNTLLNANGSVGAGLQLTNGLNRNITIDGFVMNSYTGNNNPLRFVNATNVSVNNATITGKTTIGSASSISTSSDNSMLSFTNIEVYNASFIEVSFLPNGLTFINVSSHDNYFNVSASFPSQAKDFIFSNTPNNPSFCSNVIIENFTTTGGYPVVFYNSQVSINNWLNNFSIIWLCNANNSIINNVSTNLSGNQIYVFGSSNFTLKNSYFENSGCGIGTDGTFFMSVQSDNITLDNLLYNKTTNGMLIYNTNNIKINNVRVYDSSKLINTFMNVTGNLSNIYAYRINPDNTANVRAIALSTGCNLSMNNITIDTAYDAIGISLSDKNLINISNSNFINIGNNSIFADTRYYFGYTLNAYNSNFDGKIFTYCSSPATNNCSMIGLINLFNSTAETYSINGNSSLNAYWNLLVNNPLNAQIQIQNATGNTIESFDDSRNIWIKQYYIIQNVITNSTPHNITSSKSGYTTNITEITMNMNLIFNAILSQITVPVIDPSSITGQLILSLGFGIMGLFAILSLLGLGYVTATGKPDTDTFIKIVISIVIIILAIVAVWQGIVI
jgi:hypothetical protein